MTWHFLTRTLPICLQPLTSNTSSGFLHQGSQLSLTFSSLFLPQKGYSDARGCLICISYI